MGNWFNHMWLSYQTPTLSFRAHNNLIDPSFTIFMIKIINEFLTLHYSWRIQIFHFETLDSSAPWLCSNLLCIFLPGLFEGDPYRTWVKILCGEPRYKDVLVIPSFLKIVHFNLLYPCNHEQKRTVEEECQDRDILPAFIEIVNEVSWKTLM